MYPPTNPILVSHVYRKVGSPPWQTPGLLPIALPRWLTLQPAPDPPTLECKEIITPRCHETNFELLPSLPDRCIPHKSSRGTQLNISQQNPS